MTSQKNALKTLNLIYRNVTLFILEIFSIQTIYKEFPKPTIALFNMAIILQRKKGRKKKKNKINSTIPKSGLYKIRLLQVGRLEKKNIFVSYII